MKKFLYIFIAVVMISCETEVDPDLETSLNVLVVDAWLTTDDPIQHINLSRSQPYFEAELPVKVEGATVTITDLTDPSVPVFVFNEGAERYTWESMDGSTLGVSGHQYQLSVELAGLTYTSITEVAAVPAIDSISFRLEEATAFFDELIFCELFATDLEGIDDTYWIKTWKNGKLMGRPSEINIAYDAAFSPDPDNDGVQFIQPIRDGINPFDEARNGDDLSPYNLPDTLLVDGDTLRYKNDGSIYGIVEDDQILFEVEGVFTNNNVPDDLESLPLSDDRYVASGGNELYVKGDSIYVEIHSISNDAFFFLSQVVIETTRTGGFGALFATPLANVSTNIIPSDPNSNVVGFFNIASVSSEGARLNNIDQIRRVQ